MILPRVTSSLWVTSLVVSGLGVSAPTLKAQSLDLLAAGLLNLRLSHMSFLLPSLLLLSWFQHAGLLLSIPLCWISFVFDFYSMSYCQIWLLPCLVSALAGAELRLFQPGYIQVTAPDTLGECLISSVLSCSSKDLKQWTSVNSLVTAQRARFTFQASEPSGLVSS